MRMLSFSDFDKCTLEPNECRKIIQIQNILRNCWIDKFEVPLPEIDGMENILFHKCTMMKQIALGMYILKTLKI